MKKHPNLYKSEDIIMHIKHYEIELHESYNLLEILDNGEVKGNNVLAQTNIEQTIEYIKIVCFFTCCFLDIASSLRGLVDCETNWERKFYLKNGFVVIYESAKTFRQHQKKIFNLIQSDFPELETRYKGITQDLKKLKKEHKFDSLITNFRNKAGAHYDEDFVTYFKHLKSIDKPISVKTMSDFSNFLMSLLIFWSDLIDVFKEKTEKEMEIIRRKN